MSSCKSNQFQVYKGKCVKFNVWKGFGFIALNNEQNGDIFVHENEILYSKIAGSLQIGEEVEFEMVTSDDGTKKAIRCIGINHKKSSANDSAEPINYHYNPINMVYAYLKHEIQQKYNINIISIDIQKLCHMFYEYKDLIIQRNETKILKNNDKYYYNSIIIKEGGTLTVDEGRLNIICYDDVILEHGASINVNGKGYIGGKHEWNGGKKGKSYNGISGGGGGLYGSGGGGGYATNGFNGQYLNNKNNTAGSGGQIFGDKELTKLYCGSGGGGGGYGWIGGDGGNGGGILLLFVGNLLKLNKNASIKSNGTRGSSVTYSGSGSGGSIFIIIDNLENIEMDKNGIIEAIGGPSHKQLNNKWKCSSMIHNIGKGGDGRIRIQTSSQSKCVLKKLNITPQPCVG